MSARKGIIRISLAEHLGDEPSEGGGLAVRKRPDPRAQAGLADGPYLVDPDLSEYVRPQGSPLFGKEGSGEILTLFLFSNPPSPPFSKGGTRKMRGVGSPLVATPNVIELPWECSRPRRQHPGHREGTVTTGAAGTCPVSASENRIIRNVKVRLLAMSLSSIQYHWPL
jgi:hypothetical protein